MYLDLYTIGCTAQCETSRGKFHLIAILSVSKFEEIKNACDVTERQINTVLSSDTVANVGDF